MNLSRVQGSWDRFYTPCESY